MTCTRLLVTLPLCLAGCIGSPEPSRLERQVAVWKQEEAAKNAALTAESVHHQGEAAAQRATEDEEDRNEARRFAAGVAAQRAASGRLTLVMHACVTAGVHRRAYEIAPAPPQAADAILAECRPSIEAVARTVELAGLSSVGLARDIGARLWPRLVAGITQERARNVRLGLPRRMP